MERQEIKNLKKRYLLWLYKATKEALDRIERKFTQLEIDRFILGELKRSGKARQVNKFIGEFSEYIRNKEKDAMGLKYEAKGPKPDYMFLALKLKAIEKAIIKELGKGALKGIRDSYAQEMLRRIMEERADKI